MDGAGPQKNRVRLFHFNDFHRRLKPFEDGDGGADRLVGKIRELEAENPDSVTLNVGDLAGDNRAQGPDHFSPIPDLFNRAGVDIVGLGNHEFEDPENRYQSLVSGFVKPFQGDVLVANVSHADGSPIEGTKPYVIRKIQEHNIAFIGTVTRELTSAVFPAAGAGLKTLPIEDVLRELVPKLKPQADAIVVLNHDNLGNSRELTRNIPDIDLTLAAHDHVSTDSPEPVTQSDGTTGWVAEAEAYGQSIGQVDLFFDDEGLVKVEGKQHKVDLSSPSDPVAKKFMDDYEPLPRVEVQEIKKKWTSLSSFEELAKHFPPEQNSKDTHR